MTPRNAVKATKLAKPTKAKAARQLRVSPGAVPVNRRLSPDERRAQIVDVVAELFSSRAYQDISVADVARAAGVTEGLIYHYFDTRTGLFAAAIALSCAQLLQASIPDLKLTLPAQFEQGLRGYLDYAEEHRTAFLNVFRGPAAHEPEYQHVIEQTRMALVEHIVQVLGIAEHELPVTRLSLRGYVAFGEATVLAWLEREAVSRNTLERLLYNSVLTAVSSGLALEGKRPLTTEQRQRIEDDFRAHFQL